MSAPARAANADGSFDHVVETPLFQTEIERHIPEVDHVIVLNTGTAEDLAAAFAKLGKAPRRIAVKRLTTLSGITIPEGVEEATFDSYEYRVDATARVQWPSTLKRVYFHSRNVPREKWFSADRRCPGLPATVEQCWLRGSYPPSADPNADPAEDAPHNLFDQGGIIDTTCTEVPRTFMDASIEAMADEVDRRYDEEPWHADPFLIEYNERIDRV